MKKWILLLFGAIFTFVCLMDFTNLSAQNIASIESVKDNTIFSEDNTRSNGAGQYLFAGTTNNLVHRRSVLMFEIPDSIPAQADIESVELILHLSKAGLITETSVSAHRLSGDWGEAGSNASLNEGSGAQALEGDATWTYSFFESDSWSAAGGDFEQDASSTLVLGRSTGFYSWTGPGMVDDVRFWLQNRDKNFGWILKGDESVLKSTRRFDSHENASPDFHPKLKIQYAEPVSVQKNAQTGLFHARAYPNPFMERLTIEYHLDREREVELRIINILGKEIRSLVKDYIQNGIMHVSWDGLDDSGSPVNPGMYYVILRADNEKHIIKVIKSL